MLAPSVYECHKAFWRHLLILATNGGLVVIYSGFCAYVYRMFIIIINLLMFVAISHVNVPDVDFADHCPDSVDFSQVDDRVLGRYICIAEYDVMRSLNCIFSEGSDNEKDVLEAVIKVAANYYSVGMMLGLPSNELNNITSGCPGDPKRALGQVVMTWLKQLYNVKKHGLPSWRAVVRAVGSPAGGCNHALAKQIASSHQGKL